MDFLLCGKAGIVDIRLNEHGTNFAVSIFGKANHTIGTGVKVFVMSLYSFKEWCEVIVRISKIIQFDDFRTIFG